jgi:hypothetical protein
MKLTTELRELMTSSDLQTSRFQMGDPRIIQWILRDKLYRDKLRVVVQEYLSNARDAHREAGVTCKPVQVQLPTRLDQRLVIRDFGPGISRERFEKVFVVYGESTKRENDDETGGFGIGAKSAFSYTDTFMVVTWHGGEKRTYSCFIDDEDYCTSSLLHVTESDEPNGTEIQVPIKDEDIDRARQLVVWLTYFWNPRPIITPEEAVPADTEFFDKKHALEGSNFLIAPKSKSNLNLAGGDSYAVIDGIPFATTTQVSWSPSHGYAQYIFFKTGEVSVSATRDGYEENENNRQVVHTASEKVSEELPDLLSEYFDSIDILKNGLSGPLVGLANRYTNQTDGVKTWTHINGVPTVWAPDHKKFDSAQQTWIEVAGLPLSLYRCYSSSGKVSNWGVQENVTIWSVATGSNHYLVTGKAPQAVMKAVARSGRHGSMVIIHIEDVEHPDIANVLKFLRTLDNVTDLTEQCAEVIEERKNSKGTEYDNVILAIEQPHFSQVGHMQSNRKKLWKTALDQRRVVEQTKDGMYRVVWEGEEKLVTQKELWFIIRAYQAAKQNRDPFSVVVVPDRRAEELSEYYTLLNVDDLYSDYDPTKLWHLQQHFKGNRPAVSGQVRKLMVEVLKPADVIHSRHQRRIDDVFGESSTTGYRTRYGNKLSYEDPTISNVIEWALKKGVLKVEEDTIGVELRKIGEILSSWFDQNGFQMAWTAWASAYGDSHGLTKSDRRIMLWNYIQYHFFHDVKKLQKLYKNQADAVQLEKERREREEKEAADKKAAEEKAYRDKLEALVNRKTSIVPKKKRNPRLIRLIRRKTCQKTSKRIAS